MTTQAIDSVVFDLGGVLVDWNPRYLYRKLLPSEAEIEWFLEHVCTEDWNHQQDAGRPIAHANRELIERHPEHRELIEAYYGRWLEMVGGPIHETVEVLRELRAANVRVLFLSNWSAETFPLAQARFDFLHWFEGGVLSGLERLVKPDPKIYELLIQRFAVNPERSLYVDDRVVNLAPAATLGMAVHHFKVPKDFRRVLDQHGVL